MIRPHLMPMSDAPRDGTVIIAVYTDASGVEAIRFAEGTDDVFRWYDMEDKALSDEDETSYWLGWFYPPENIRWPDVASDEAERVWQRYYDYLVKRGATAAELEEWEQQRKPGQKAAAKLEEGNTDG